MPVPIRIFLSYASEDFEAVSALYDRLKEPGYEPWMDRRDILAGEKWEQSIWRAVRRADIFIAVVSSRSVNKRGFLQKEIRHALKIWEEKFEDDIYIIPARLEKVAAPEALAEFEWVDLFEEEGFTRLRQSIAEAERRMDRRTDAHNAALAGISIRNEHLTDSGTAPREYAISLEYLQFDGPPELGLDEVDTRIRSLMLAEAHEARGVVFAESIGTEDAPIQPSTTLDGFCQATYISDELISIVFDFSSYNYPAAHPNFYRRTLTFALRPVATMTFYDIFEYDPRFNAHLAELCDEGIRREYDGEFGLSSFSPVLGDSDRDHSSRFELFNISTDGIAFSFVGPYVVKIAQVTIPFSVLRPYLSPRTPVAKLAKN